MPRAPASQMVPLECCRTHPRWLKGPEITIVPGNVAGNPAGLFHLPLIFSVHSDFEKNAKRLVETSQLEWVPARPLGTSSAGHDGDFNELFYQDTLENQVWHFDFLIRLVLCILLHGWNKNEF